MTLFEHDKQKIKTAWQDVTHATHDFDKAENIDDLVKLRQLVEHRLSAFDVTCRSIFAINKELKEFQLPAKDGFVSYETVCGSWAWKIVEWLMQLQEIIDKCCRQKECGHQHLFDFETRQAFESTPAVVPFSSTSSNVAVSK